jgi:hypothetical protein
LDSSIFHLGLAADDQVERENGSTFVEPQLITDVHAATNYLHGKDSIERITSCAL